MDRSLTETPGSFMDIPQSTVYLFCRYPKTSAAQIIRKALVMKPLHDDSKNALGNAPPGFVLTLESISEIWEKDSPLDIAELGKESCRLPNLYGKYLGLHSVAR